MVMEYLDESVKTVLFSAIKVLPLIPLFFLFSYLVKGKAALQAFKSAMPNTAMNIYFMVLNIFLVAPVLNMAVGLFSDISSTPLKVLWAELPDGVVIVIAVFVGDFVAYWRHRFEHSRLLWPSHAVHHSDTHMTWFTLQRFHPVNFLSTYFIDNACLLLMGFPPYALIANNMIRHYYGYFIHADLPWTYGVLGRIFVSPSMHRWHHALEVEAHHTNFATVFSVFDQCFGTYRVPGACDVPLGVRTHMKKGFWSQVFYPLNPNSYRKKYYSSKKSNTSHAKGEIDDG